LPLTDEQIGALLRDPRRAPPASVLLGFEMLAFSVEQGWAEVAFTPKPSFANPVGSVQGGFVAAMLDDAMGVAASIHARFEKVVPTLQLNVVFLKPTPFERVIARGEVTRLGQNTCLLASTLRTAAGDVLATATASAAVRAFPAAQRLGSATP
jgi:uncharacterized protein (TIGR00369 family)